MTASPEILQALREQIALSVTPNFGVLPFDDPRIDAHLPGGGLPLGQLHEIGADGIEAETGTLVAAFAAGLAARLAARSPGDHDQVVLWIATQCDLYAPGLLPYGLDPGRLILVRTGSDSETLQAMETALRSGAAIAVLGEVGRLPLLATRRLQLACLGGGTTGFVLRRWPRGRKPAPAEGNAASTRWRLRPNPSAPDRHQAGPPRWQLELLHARGGRPGAWIVHHEEADDDGQTHPLRVVAVLGDHAAGPRAPQIGRRAAG